MNFYFAASPSLTQNKESPKNPKYDYGADSSQINPKGDGAEVTDAWAETQLLYRD